MERVKKWPKDHLQFNRALFREKRELIQNQHQHLCRHAVSLLPFSLRKVKNHYAIAISEHSEMLLQKSKASTSIMVNVYCRMHTYIILSQITLPASASSITFSKLPCAASQMLHC